MGLGTGGSRGELPQIARLRAEFRPEELDLLAVPVDEDDSREKLEAYRNENSPAYELLLDLPETDVAAVQKVVLDELRVDALPASILTDGQGRVLGTFGYVPSVSEIRAFLDGAES